MRFVSRALLVLIFAACSGPTQVVEPAPLPPAPPPAAAAKGDLPPAALRGLLTAHNQLRARHCAPALAWSRRLAQVAQAWADRLARRCALEHSRGRLGENLAAGTAGSMSAADVARLWYSEVRGYNFRRGGFSMNTGHFTQLVWRSSAQLGCGASVCRGLQIWVCNYDPPGNVQGNFPRNVLPQSCRASR